MNEPQIKLIMTTRQPLSSKSG